MTSNVRQQSKILTLLLAGIYTASVVILVIRLAQLKAFGGNAWQQADWLINNEGGLVRRGFSGELFLGASDLLNLPVVDLVIWVQGAFTLMIFVGVFLAFWRVGIGQRMFILALSPAFLAFWITQPEAPFRKEILGYAAFLPLMVAANLPRGQGIAIAASAVLSTFAAALHEANAFLAPFLVIAIVMVRNRSPLAMSNILIGVGFFAVAAAALVFAFLFPGTGSKDAMCAAVMARGASPEVCEGIFRWFELGVQDHFDGVKLYVGLGPIPAAFISAIVVFLTVAQVFWAAPERWRILNIVAGSWLVFAPMYVLAIDWGRWISMQVFAVVFLTLIYGMRFRPNWLHSPMRPVPFVLFLSICLFYGMHHVSANVTPGLLLSPVDAELVIRMK